MIFKATSPLKQTNRQRKGPHCILCLFFSSRLLKVSANITITAMMTAKAATRMTATTPPITPGEGPCSSERAVERQASYVQVFFSFEDLTIAETAISGVARVTDTLITSNCVHTLRILAAVISRSSTLINICMRLVAIKLIKGYFIVTDLCMFLLHIGTLQNIYTDWQPTRPQGIL